MTIEIRQETDPDGRVRTYVVGGWPDDVVATADLIDGANTDRRLLRLEGDKVRFVVANGEALYQRVGHDKHGHIRLRKISSSLEPGK